MRILILSESIAGSGHTIAAKNVAKGIHLLYPKAEIKIDTSLTRVSPLLEKVTSHLYLSTIQRASPLWGWAYNRERQWSFLGKDLLRKFTGRRLESYIKEESPDVVISTHAFCLGGLVELKQKYPHSFVLGAAFTDFLINPFWIFPEVDFYFVGADQLKKQMVEHYGISAENIFVTGIPIDPVFNQSLSRETIRNYLQIPPNHFHILVTGGGLGVGAYEEILSALGKVDGNLTVSVFVGNNQKLRREIESLLTEYLHPVFLHDYVSNMNEWMQAADLLIGKPGGLTVSEALACSLPLLIYKPIPGQEERNTRFLLASEAAWQAKSPEEIIRLVQQLLVNPRDLILLRQKAQQISRPNAAKQVGEIILEKTNATPKN
ncbi:MGDG synthase family glycosyltransferase [Ammoniphilus resinae]|uniref:Processive 1,2-diacylglycerol beta-glucosyltransferase n=1 Tax=Ammoniphilus resinae TaxID=861532 RepID=A0ABS4GRH0_9BACL|nr:processive 1,2-diacylglycerol beta-glucosyltransferase [Ammoniphilus resinae]